MEFIEIKSELIVFVIAWFIVTAPAVAATSLAPGQIFRDCPNCPEIVVIPSGDFTMGSSPADIDRDLKDVAPDEKKEMIPGLTQGAEDFIRQETPQHAVHIANSFGLGKYPVTRAEFSAFVHETGYDAKKVGCTLYSSNKTRDIPEANWENPGFPQTGKDPVVCVNINDVEAYVTWLNSKINKTEEGVFLYRLPSEAEWEYAARGGTRTAFWWGDTIGTSNSTCRECGSRWDYKQTAPVGSFKPNPFGLYDVSGNVWEWTADCWNPNYDGAPANGSAWKSGDCQSRSTRGGAWDGAPWTLRSADRGKPLAIRRANYLGFRVVRNLPSNIQDCIPPQCSQ